MWEVGAEHAGSPFGTSTDGLARHP